MPISSLFPQVGMQDSLTWQYQEGSSGQEPNPYLHLHGGWHGGTSPHVDKNSLCNDSNGWVLGRLPFSAQLPKAQTNLSFN